MSEATIGGTPPGGCLTNDAFVVDEVTPLSNTFLANGKNRALFTFKTAAQTVARTPGCPSIRTTINLEGPEAASFFDADFFAPFDPVTNPRGSCLDINANCLHWELVGSRLSP